MRQEFFDILMCPVCGKNTFRLEKTIENDIEIIKGKLFCKSCSTYFDIKDGIVDFLKNPAISIIREKKAMHEDEYIEDESGNRYKITDETIDKFKDRFLSLPEGDGSYFFRRGGSFQSIRDASQRFYKTLQELSLKGDEKVLEIGAGFSWASYRFAKRGCKVVAMDISNYLKASSLYIRDIYFDRTFADMHNIPFADNTFDIVFVDPPYQDVEAYDLSLQALYGFDILNPTSCVVCEHATKIKLCELPYPVISTHRYGSTTITIFSH